MQQASQECCLALGVAGLIMLASTDLSVGHIVVMGMTAATIIMHNGPNTGSDKHLTSPNYARWWKNSFGISCLCCVMYNVYNDCRFLCG